MAQYWVVMSARPLAATLARHLVGLLELHWARQSAAKMVFQKVGRMEYKKVLQSVGLTALLTVPKMDNWKAHSTVDR